MKTKQLFAILGLAFCVILAGCSQASDEYDSTEPDFPVYGDTATSEPVQANARQQSSDEYRVFSSEEQDFSFLYDSSFTSEWNDEAGAIIYTKSGDAFPRLQIHRTIYGDTTGFAVEEYFYFEIEEMQQQFNAMAGEYQTYTISGVKIPGVMYEYTQNGKNVVLFSLMNNTGESLIKYSCFYYQDDSESSLQALAEAVGTYQPDAAYYSGGSDTLIIGDKPMPTDSDSAKPPVSASGTLGSYTVTKNTPLHLQTARYDGGFFSLDLPAGWVIETTGEYTLFGFHAYDPNISERQIFFYCKHYPLLKSMEAQQKFQELADLVGFPDIYNYHQSADTPVLLEPTTDYFFFIYNDYNKFVNKYGLNHQLPVMNDISILEKYPNNTPTAFNTLDNSIVRASFYSANGVACEGLMAGQVVNYGTDTGSVYGVDMGAYAVYNCNGVIAPAGEFNELREQLVACLASFNFTEEYVRQAQQNVAEETSAILAMSRQMQAAYDSYNAAWRARQTSYDIISQKNSDAMLGYDRLYDPDTGEVYRADLGFYDSYDINRDEYSNPNLQLIDGSTENYYLNSVDYYINN